MAKETVFIPANKARFVEREIARLNRRAAKLGCEQMVLTFTEAPPRIYKEHPLTGHIFATPLYVDMVEATLEYEIPKLNGYRVVAGLDLEVTDDGPVVFFRTAPGEHLPESYRNRGEVVCEHCNTKRNRRHTILFQHEDGHYKEIGTSCARDFFGQDPAGLLFSASIVFGDIAGCLDDDEIFSGGHAREIYELKHFLASTCGAIRAFGWLGRTKALEIGGMPTCDVVRLNILGRADESWKFKINLPADDEKADVVIEYFQNIDPGDNEYLVTLQKIANVGWVFERYDGYAASMVAAYDRAMAEKFERENALPSEFVGEIGKRLRGLELTCKFYREFEGYYGVTTMYILQDKAGNIFKTFYSGNGWSAEKGDVLLVDGTVKEHDVYMDKKNTILSRVKATLVNTEKAA